MRSLILVCSLGILFSCTSTSREAQDLNNQGVAFLDKEDYTQAENSFRQAWILPDVDPELKAGVARNLCLLFSAKEQADSALHYALKAYRMAPKDSYIYLVSRAEYALLRKNINEAIAFYEQAKWKKQDDMAVYNSLGMIYSGKYGARYENVSKALENNKKAYELSPRDPLAEALAFSYMNADKYSESLPLWKKLRSSQPANMEYLFHEGVALYFLGQEDKGMEQMESAADRNENCRKMYQEMQAN
jgi:tetratricopeptide (TPR) repeat protein